MNTSKNMILNNGKDITSDVRFCKYDQNIGRYNVTFNNGQTYPYGYMSIEWLQDPEVLNPGLYHLTHDSRELFNIQDIRVFHAKITDYWHVCFSDGSERTYDKRDLNIISSCLGDKDAQNCMGCSLKRNGIPSLRDGYAV